MLSDVVNFIEFISPGLVAASNLTVFLGSGYVALHSRVMPKWVVTILWYIGLAALLDFITHVVEWTDDPTNPLSNYNLGPATDALMHLAIAVMVGLLFFHTVWKDYIGSKERLKAKKKVVRRKTAAKKPAAKRPAIKKSSPESEDRLVI